MRSYAPVVISLALFSIGALLIFEVVRPFRDMEIEGPIALACWSIGAALAGVSTWQRQTHLAISITALLLNAIGLVAIGLLLILLSHSKWMF